jgi:uncharacterized phage protein gp47/JayE
MARFQPRTFTDFLTRMAARLVARSPLTDLEPGGVAHTMLAAVAREEDGTHFQMVNLQKVWDIDTATGEDLDRRAADVNPDELTRKTETKSAGSGVFSRGSGTDTPVVAEDTGEAPDGIVVAFAFTLGDNGLLVSTVTVDWTSGGVAKSMTDNGLGVFAGDGNAAGSTVDYVTGAVVLDTTGATPDAATAITADYTPLLGAVVIAAGTVVTQQTSGLTYETSAGATIAAGATASAPVAIVAVEAGTDSNTDAETIKGFSPITGVESFLNDTACTGGQAEETDAQFRDRIKAYLRSLPRGTPDALKYAVLGVALDAYGSIVAAEVVEGVASERGQVWIYVDDGNGTIEVTDDNAGTPETVVTATGGELRIFLANKPVVDGGAVLATLTWTPIATGVPVVLLEDDDYYLNYATGQATLIPGGSAGILTTGLSVGDIVTAEYAWFEGLIAEAQKVVDGDPTDRANYPGYRAAGVQVFVIAPTVYQQVITASVTIESGYDATTVLEKASAALNRYINGLGINGDVIFSELVHQVQSVSGVFDVVFTTPLANVVIGEGELARVKPSNITLTGA